jgi:hypothetical protein
MYFLDAISYPFKSTSWAGKAFVAFLLSVIPIVNIFGMIVLSGYTLRTAREVLAGNSELPEFDFGEDAMKGFMLLITSIVYELPLLFIYSRMRRTMSGRTTIDISGELLLLLIVITIVTSLFLLIATARYVATDDFGVFIDFGGNFALMSRSFGSIVMYAINAILFGLAGGILVLLGTVLCIIPGIVVGVMLTFGRGYLLARFVQDIGLSLDEGKLKNDHLKNDFSR